MKNSLPILIFLFIISCGNADRKTDHQDDELSYEQKKLTIEKVGQIYYERNCLKCHANKGMRDQHLEYAIKSDKYEFEFLKSYLTNHDSLIQNENEIALELKKEWGDQTFLHEFELNENEIKALIYYLKK